MPLGKWAGCLSQSHFKFAECGLLLDPFDGPEDSKSAGLTEFRIVGTKGLLNDFF